MSRRTTGTFLLVIAAILYMSRYLTAAIFGSSTQGWNADFFNALLRYVGNNLVVWSLAALILGLIYMIWAEVETLVQAKTG